MNPETRRNQILSLLSQATAPVSASKLASEFGVSRQVIVQDVALLRANGISVSSLARGYVLEGASLRNTNKVFKIYHSDEDVEKELNLIVDAGGTVEDVFIYHRVYGKVKAQLGIKSRLDVKRFLGDIASGKSSLLKNVTSGYHYHTVSAESPEVLDHIEESLTRSGFLAPLQEYEPTEINR